MPYIKITELEAQYMREYTPSLQIVDTRDQILTEVITINEAADLWRINPSTIRQAIRRGRLIPDEDCRQYKGGPWTITKSAMYRVFGPEPQEGDYPGIMIF